MAQQSIFQPGRDGEIRGGLDRFLGPEARDASRMPEHIDDAKANPDEQKIEIDCAGDDANEAVCEIAKAEEEERETGANAT